MLLTLTEKQAETLKEEARRNCPAETCGLLFGRKDENAANMERIVFLPNIASSPVRFEVDPIEAYRVLVEADRGGEDLVAIFHSHPAPAEPSCVDLNYMRLWGETIWLVLSTLDWSFATFYMKNNEVCSVKIRFIEEPHKKN